MFIQTCLTQHYWVMAPTLLRSSMLLVPQGCSSHLNTILSFSALLGEGHGSSTLISSTKSISFPTMIAQIYIFCPFLLWPTAVTTFKILCVLCGMHAGAHYLARHEVFMCYECQQSVIFHIQRGQIGWGGALLNELKSFGVKSNWSLMS